MLESYRCCWCTLFYRHIVRTAWPPAPAASSLEALPQKRRNMKQCRRRQPAGDVAGDAGTDGPVWLMLRRSLYCRRRRRLSCRWGCRDAHSANSRQKSATSRTCCRRLSCPAAVAASAHHGVYHSANRPPKQTSSSSSCTCGGVGGPTSAATCPPEICIRYNTACRGMRRLISCGG